MDVVDFDSKWSKSSKFVIMVKNKIIHLTII